VTRFLSADDVAALGTHDVVMEAARDAVRAEREGTTILPARLDVDLPSGFLRVMPAAIGDVMGLKVMTLAKGLGTRYLVLVYAKASGELLAALDADEITRLRTAATTAVAGEMLAPAGTDTLGLIGSGFEAEGHLRLLARVWPLRTVSVYSRSAERRIAFAARMADELGIDVRAADSMEAAVADAPISVLATKSTEPVVDGAAFPPGAVVLSIGSTRPDLRELDRATLRRAAVLLVDDAVQVTHESGDVIDGLECGALDSERIVSMAAIDGGLAAATDGRDLLAFKSVGTAVHDLSLAVALCTAAERAGRGRELGELTRLKPFADVVATAVEGAS
jgi:ornithine cyclodeaminase/alanine dehydrogenase-like protein (mu-crystallin family)